MMPCGRNASVDHHDDEGEHDAVGRQVDEAELLGQADQQRADGGAGESSPCRRR